MEQKHYSPKYFTDLEGKRFGKLTAIRFDAFKPKANRQRIVNEAYWIVRCDCGIEKSLRRNVLVPGRARSCGCSRGEFARQTNGKSVGEITGSIWNAVTQNAKARNHSVSITQQEAWELFQKQNGLCALSGVQLVLFCLKKTKNQKTASLDRIDSSKGYEVGNVQWIHKDLNKMKNTFSQEVFLDWIKRIQQFKNL